ncbi:MAG: hypothetical protein PHG58_02305 [Clostridia bacterium]|nr:hypothetical protein [Clostridia bacterium]
MIKARGTRCEAIGIRIRDTGCGLRDTRYEIRVAGCEIRDTRYRLRVARYEIQDTRYEIRVELAMGAR